MAEDRDQQIRQRAYRIWQDEGEPAGREQEHWARAEAELGATEPDGAGTANDDELVPGSSEDLPFGEPEDTGVADASLAGGESASSTSQSSQPSRPSQTPSSPETPQTSGIAAAAGTPLAPAPKGRKGKGRTKAST